MEAKYIDSHRSSRYVTTLLDHLAREGQVGWTVTDVCAYPPDPYGSFVRGWMTEHPQSYAVYTNARIVTLSHDDEEQRYIVSYDPCNAPGYEYQIILFHPPRRLILVVDGDPNLRDALRLILEPEGYCIIEAATGEEALLKLRGVKPDLIIWDVFLSGMTGIEFGQRLCDLGIRAEVSMMILSTAFMQSVQQAMTTTAREKQYNLVTLRYEKKQRGVIY